MKKVNFLNKLNKEGKLKLVESSEIIKTSYLEKAENSLKSSKILLKNNLYENSISMSYYVMYNSLIALLYKIGIKCENHTGSILLLELLLEQKDLAGIILSAKEERIDKQYYVTYKDEFQLNEKSTKEMMEDAEKFLIEMKLVIENTKNEDVLNYRKKLANVLGGKK